jgi:hypothetical protein
MAPAALYHEIAAALIVLCLCAGIFIYRKLPGLTVYDKIVAAALPLAVVIMLAVSAERILFLPFDAWNHNRLVPAFALAHGIKTFGLPDSGPVISWMYGPMAAAAYLPSAIASSADAGILLAGMLSFAFFCGPLVLVMLGATAGAAPWRRVFACCAAFFMAFLLSLKSPALVGPQFGIHVDSPSLGFAGAACALLMLKGRNSRPVPLAASAVFAVLAVFTKQNMLPLLAVLPAWVLLSHGRGAFVKYACAMAAAGLCLGAAVVWFYGSPGAFFSVLRMPLSYPWVDITPGVYTESPLINGAQWFRRISVLGIASCELVVFSLPFLLVIGSGGAVLSRRRQGRAQPAGLLLRASEKAWALPVFIAVATIPFSLLARAKLGGNFNSYAATLYFLTIAASSVLAELFLPLPAATAGKWRLAAATRTFFVGMVLVAAVMAAWKVPPHIADLVSRLRDSPMQQAYRYAKARPAQAYFPHFPLATLLADGKLYHSAYGLWDLHHAGKSIDNARWSAYLPPDMRVAAFHKDSRYDKSDHVEKLLAASGFTRQASADSTGEWIFFTQETAGPLR